MVNRMKHRKCLEQFFYVTQMSATIYDKSTQILVCADDHDIAIIGRWMEKVEIMFSRN